MILSMWNARNSESGIKIFRKWIKEDFNEEFKKFKNCNEEILQFRKRSSQNKIKKLRNWDKKYSKWDSRRSKIGKINLSMWDARNSESGRNIFRKRIKEDFNEEFKKFKNCNEDVLKLRKRSSQNKIKK